MTIPPIQSFPALIIKSLSSSFQRYLSNYFGNLILPPSKHLFISTDSTEMCAPEYNYGYDAGAIEEGPTASESFCVFGICCYWCSIWTVIPRCLGCANKNSCLCIESECSCRVTSFRTVCAHEGFFCCLAERFSFPPTSRTPCGLACFDWYFTQKPR